MFGMSTEELIVVLIVALVVLGPDHLPAMARALGRMMREFRKATREIQATLEVEDVRRTIRQRVEKEKAALEAESEGAQASRPTDKAAGAPLQGSPGGARDEVRQHGPMPAQPTVSDTGPGKEGGEEVATEQPEPELEEYLADRPGTPRLEGSGGQPSGK